MEICTWVKDKAINATPSETNPYRASREKLSLTAAGIRTDDCILSKFKRNRYPS